MEVRFGRTVVRLEATASNADIADIATRVSQEEPQLDNLREIQDILRTALIRKVSDLNLRGAQRDALGPASPLLQAATQTSTRRTSPPRLPPTFDVSAVDSYLPPTVLPGLAILIHPQESPGGMITEDLRSCVRSEIPFLTSGSLLREALARNPERSLISGRYNVFKHRYYDTFCVLPAGLTPRDVGVQNVVPVPRDDVLYLNKPRFAAQRDPAAALFEMVGRTDGTKPKQAVILTGHGGAGAVAHLSREVYTRIVKTIDARWDVPVWGVASCYPRAVEPEVSGVFVRFGRVNQPVVGRLYPDKFLAGVRESMASTTKEGARKQLNEAIPKALPSESFTIWNAPGHSGRSSLDGVDIAPTTQRRLAREATSTLVVPSTKPEICLYTSVANIDLDVSAVSTDDLSIVSMFGGPLSHYIRSVSIASDTPTDLAWALCNTEPGLSRGSHYAEKTYLIDRLELAHSTLRHVVILDSQAGFQMLYKDEAGQAHLVTQPLASANGKLLSLHPTPMQSSLSHAEYADLFCRFERRAHPQDLAQWTAPYGEQPQDAHSAMSDDWVRSLSPSYTMTRKPPVDFAAHLENLAPLTEDEAIYLARNLLWTGKAHLRVSDVGAGPYLGRVNNQTTMLELVARKAGLTMADLAQQDGVMAAALNSPNQAQSVALLDAHGVDWSTPLAHLGGKPPFCRMLATPEEPAMQPILEAEKDATGASSPAEALAKVIRQHIALLDFENLEVCRWLAKTMKDHHLDLESGFLQDNLNVVGWVIWAGSAQALSNLLAAGFPPRSGSDKHLALSLAARLNPDGPGGAKSQCWAKQKVLLDAGAPADWPTLLRAGCLLENEPLTLAAIENLSAAYPPAVERMIKLGFTDALALYLARFPIKDVGAWEDRLHEALAERNEAFQVIWASPPEEVDVPLEVRRHAMAEKLWPFALRARNAPALRTLMGETPWSDSMELRAVMDVAITARDATLLEKLAPLVGQLQLWPSDQPRFIECLFKGPAMASAIVDLLASVPPPPVPLLRQFFTRAQVHHDVGAMRALFRWGVTHAVSDVEFIRAANESRDHALIAEVIRRYNKSNGGLGTPPRPLKEFLANLPAPLVPYAADIQAALERHPL